MSVEGDGKAPTGKRSGDHGTGLTAIAVGCTKDLTAQIEAACAGQPIQLESCAQEALTRLDEQRLFDIIILGPEVDDAVRQAQQTNRQQAGRRTLIVAPADRFSAVRQALLMAPFVSKQTSCISVDDRSAVENELAKVFHAAAARLSHGQRVEAAQRDVSKIAPPARPAEGFLLGRVLETVPVGLAVLDADQAMITLNPAARKLLGIGLRDQVTGTFEDLLPSSARSRFQELWQDVVDGTVRNAGFEYMGEPTDAADASDGPIISLRLHPLRAGTGHQGHIMLLQDVTGQRRMETLRVARDAAVEANRMKDEFLANMSHEIRTPLNAVIGLASLLMDTKLDLEQRDYVQTVRTSGEHLLTILNDILDYSKIEAGRMELESRPLELREIVEQALDVIAGPAFQKNLNVAYTMDDRVPQAIRGDPTRLRQVLLNLLTNAVRFTHEGEVVVRVGVDGQEAEPASADESDASRVVLRFEVADTGIGIDDEYMATIFHPFTQADPSTTREYGGTGLGLAIVRSLVEHMGGTVDVESGPGEGSTFTFTVPATVAPSSTIPVDQRPLTTLQGKHCLVVDDNATNRQVVEHFLNAWGVRTSSYMDSSEALAVTTSMERPPDLAVLDHHMPKLDGLGLARRIRALPGCEKMPILLLTSGGSVQATRAMIPEPFLVSNKPVKPTVLHENLLALTGSGPTADAAHPTQTGFDRALGTRHPMRILVVEDNEVNRKVLVRILERLGYDPDTATNGLEALESVDESSYDLMFMDVQMPVMDGLEATRRLRAHPPSPTRPWIVAMTAHVGAEDRRRCQEAGMDSYVAKPASVQAIVAAIYEAAKEGVGSPGSEGGAEKQADSRVDAGADSETHDVAAPADDVGKAVSIEDVLDLRCLDQMRDLARENPDFLDELSGLFFSDAKRLRHKLATAIHQGDSEAVVEATHTLAGASTSLCARRLESWLREIENAARDDDKLPFQSDLEKLDEMLGLVEAAWTKFTEQLRVKR